MTKTISDLQLDAVFLAGLIGGGEVLFEKARHGADDDPLAKLAQNSMPAIFEDMRHRAEAIANELEKIEDRRGAA